MKKDHKALSIAAMRLLAIETSSSIGSIALRSGNDVAERSIPTPREQSDLVLPHIDELLAGAGLRLKELDALVLGRGPGSFTGLRIAAAVVQGLGFAADLPVVSISSLEALAQRAWREFGIGDALLCVDARMREVYVARYTVQGARARLVGDERLVSPEQVTVLEGGGEGVVGAGWAAVGDGWEKYRDLLAPALEGASRVVPDLLPSARDLLAGAEEEFAAGRVLRPEEALPVYLRDESAWRK